MYQRFYRLLRVLLMKRHHVVSFEKPPVRHHPFVMASLEVQVVLVQDDLGLDLLYQVPVVRALVGQCVREVDSPLTIAHRVYLRVQVHLGRKLFGPGFYAGPYRPRHDAITKGVRCLLAFANILIVLVGKGTSVRQGETRVSRGFRCGVATQEYVPRVLPAQVLRGWIVFIAPPVGLRWLGAVSAPMVSTVAAASCSTTVGSTVRGSPALSV